MVLPLNCRSESLDSTIVHPKGASIVIHIACRAELEFKYGIPRNSKFWGINLTHVVVFNWEDRQSMGPGITNDVEEEGMEHINGHISRLPHM
jgi:hypothetical protein